MCANSREREGEQRRMKKGERPHVHGRGTIVVTEKQRLAR